MNENKYICRLCLLIVDTFEKLDEIKLQMCAVVLPSIVQVYYESVICNYCLESLQQSFDFKTICLDNEESLNMFFINGKSKLSLRELVPNTLDIVKQEDENEDELSVCRLCFKYFESTLFTDLSRIEDDFFLRDMVENCIPEINLNSTHNAAVCQNCMHLLQNQFNLISTFVDTNDKINDYISSMDEGNKTIEVDLYKVLHFVANIKKEKSPSYAIQEIKSEFSYDEPLDVDIKLEENLQLDEHYEDDFIDQALPSNVKNEAFKKNSQGIYTCNSCSHETTLRPSMLLHQQIHNQTTYFKCHNCDFTTKWRTSMTQHCWLHQEVKMFKCEICQYKTRYKKHLKRHSKRHQDPDTLQKYQCQHCKFSTRYRNSYKFHNKTKHKKDVVFEDESYSCGDCDFVTYQKILLTKHRKKVHIRYICEHCGKQKKTQYHLKEHLLTHKKNTEVAMLQCTKCSFRTKYKRSLRAHLLSH